MSVSDRYLELLDLLMNENQLLTKLPVKDLAKKNICEGHLFLSLGERKFYLMKPGVFIDRNFIKKYAVKDTVFDFESVVNLKVKENFQILFKELRYLQFEKDLRIKCNDILRYFQECFSSNEHILSFALACHEEFCQLPLDDQSRMHETDMHLYRKALYSSAFSIITGMANDYYHFTMLRDFYNITFALDIGLCDPNYSYYVAEACNEENKKPGAGKEYLETQRASELEKGVFHAHPEKGYSYLKGLSLLAYPELCEIALYQHELANGQGFPRGIKKGQVSSWEAIVLFSDALVEISPEYSFEKEVLKYLLTFQNQKLEELPVGKVFKKVVRAFPEFSVKEDSA